MKTIQTNIDDLFPIKQKVEDEPKLKLTPFGGIVFSIIVSILAVLLTLFISYSFNLHLFNKI